LRREKKQFTREITKKCVLSSLHLSTHKHLPCITSEALFCLLSHFMRFLFPTRLINNSSLGLLRSPHTTAPIRSLWFRTKSPVFRSATTPIMTAVAFSSSLSIPPTSEEALPGKLWIKFNRECLFSIYSPFAVCLAAGNLKIDTFRQYIAQDVHFLKAFAQA